MAPDKASSAKNTYNEIVPIYEFSTSINKMHLAKRKKEDLLHKEEAVADPAGLGGWVGQYLR